MKFNRKIRDRSRNRIQLTLRPEEIQHLEEAASARGTTVTRFLQDLVRETYPTQTGLNEKEKSQVPSDLVQVILARLSKLERIQRTLVLNTAYARGYAVATMRSAPTDLSRAIENEMTKNAKEQREFFFSLFPDQKEADGREARP